MASLSISKLSKSFGRTCVLEDISFEVADGEFCVLLGPSGCGKSTLLRIIAGLESATAGSVAIDGAAVEHLPPRERDIGFVFQNYALYPHMTVFDNLAFSLRLHGAGKEEIFGRVAEVAQLLEIDKQLQHKPQELSGGQRQRVALGRAIVRRPKLFLFDEPLSNLDATLRASMRVELARLHESLGATMLYVTHDQTEAMTLADKIVVLHGGVIQQIGAPAAIYQQPANPFVAGFVGTLRMNLLDGEISPDGSVFISGALRVDLTKLAPGRIPPGRNGAVTLGVRPEHWLVVAPSEAALQGRVEFVENLGSDGVLHLDCQGTELIARVGAKESFGNGETAYLTAAAADLHWYAHGVLISSG